MNTKLLFICLVFALPVYGQNTRPIKDSATCGKCCNVRHRISIGGSVGCGIPTEGYGLTSSTSNSTYIAGYANPGVCFSLNCSFRITKHFGLIAEGGGIINTLNKKFYYPGPTDLTGGTGGTYYIANILAGPFYSLPFKNGNIFESRLLVGSMLLEKTDIILTYNDASVGPMLSTIQGFRSAGI